MLDWRILAASFASLLIISTLIVGDFGIKDILTNIMEKISEWLGSSPFGGFVSTPKEQHNITLKIYATNLSFEPESKINITSDGVDVVDFSGSVYLDLLENRVVLNDVSKTQIRFITNEVSMFDVKIGRLELSDIKFDIESENFNLSSESGPVRIYNFFGDALISNSSVIFMGNVSMVSGDGWEIK